MQLYLRLAWRNIWRHRRRTIIIILAMALTLALMMFYDGLMNGFTDVIYGNAVKVLGGNIQVHAEGYRAQANSTPLLPLTDPQAVIKSAEANPLVLAATQRINTGGLVTSREGAFAVGITGVEPERELSVNIIGQHPAWQRPGRCDERASGRPDHTGRSFPTRADAPAHDDRDRHF
jgi:ABC-type lipoprotein release transport system permease subunit